MVGLATDYCVGSSALHSLKEVGSVLVTEASGFSLCLISKLEQGQVQGLKVAPPYTRSKRSGGLILVTLALLLKLKLGLSQVQGSSALHSLKEVRPVLVTLALLTKLKLVGLAYQS